MRRVRFCQRNGNTENDQASRFTARLYADWEDALLALHQLPVGQPPLDRSVLQLDDGQLVVVVLVNQLINGIMVRLGLVEYPVSGFGDFHVAALEPDSSSDGVVEKTPVG